MAVTREEHMEERLIVETPTDELLTTDVIVNGA